MRHLVYGLATTTMIGGALGLGLLPRLTTDWLWFGLIGAVLSAAGAGGWVLSGATAGAWPRPRAGWVLMLGGLAGALVNLWDWHPLALLWSLAQGVSGALLIFRLFPVGQQAGVNRRPGPVQAPVSRRSQGR